MNTEKKLTAMQEFLENIRKEHGLCFSNNVTEMYLEKEKQQICHFGAKCCIKTIEKESWTLEDLYNETFKS